MKDYPEVGVCKWDEWSETVAELLFKRSTKAGAMHQTVGFWLGQVRQKPLSKNPWRVCFARYMCTPGEAIRHMTKNYD